MPLSGLDDFTREEQEKINAMDAYILKLFNDAHTPAELRQEGIVVNGMTMHEILVDKYRENPAAYPDFKAFCDANERRITATVLTAALMTDKPVSIFTTNARGRLNPSVNHLEGCSVSPKGAAPGELTRWQRFWSHFGFYREEKAKVQEQRNAIDRARARVDFKAFERTQSSSHIQKDVYFGAWSKETGKTIPAKSPSGYSLGRSACTSFATMKLLSYGISLDKILDPTIDTYYDPANPGKPLITKSDVGKEVMANMDGVPAGKDIEWLGKNSEVAVDKLIEYIDEHLRDVDFSSIDTVLPSDSALIHCSDLCVDFMQELGRNPGTSQHWEHPEAFDDKMNTLTRMSSVLDFITIRKYAGAAVADGGNPMGPTLLAKAAAGEQTMRVLAQMRKDNPDASFSELLAPKNYGGAAEVFVNLSGVFVGTFQEALESRSSSETIAQSFIKGDFLKAMTVSQDGSIDFGMRAELSAAQHELPVMPAPQPQVGGPRL